VLKGRSYRTRHLKPEGDTLNDAA